MKKVRIVVFVAVGNAIQACKGDNMGYNWQYYFFKKGDLRYFFTIRYNKEGHNSPIGKKILETFEFAKD